MSRAALDELRAVDPARELHTAPDESLLRATIARPRPSADEDTPSADAGTSTRPRATPKSPALTWRQRVRRTLPGLAVAAGVAFAVHLAVGGDRPLDLAAEAYAQTSAAGDSILFSVVTGESWQEPNRFGRLSYRQEEWHRGERSHRLATLTVDGGRRKIVTDQLAADGKLRTIVDDSNGFADASVTRPGDNPQAADLIQTGQRGFVEEFRDRYERGELVERADTRFAGRGARAYLVEARGDEPRQVFYLDRESGRPMGSVSVLTRTDRNGRRTTYRYRQVVRRLELLEPTAANVRRLREFTLQRPTRR